jgi:hypothetical protein
MRKETGKTKPRPKRDRAGFERKVAELKAAIEKLPAARQAALGQELEEQQRQERERPKRKEAIPAKSAHQTEILKMVYGAALKLLIQGEYRKSTLDKGAKNAVSGKYASPLRMFRATPNHVEFQAGRGSRSTGCALIAFHLEQAPPAGLNALDDVDAQRSRLLLLDALAVLLRPEPFEKRQQKVTVAVARPFHGYILEHLTDLLFRLLECPAIGGIGLQFPVVRLGRDVGRLARLVHTPGSGICFEEDAHPVSASTGWPAGSRSVPLFS